MALFEQEPETKEHQLCMVKVGLFGDDKNEDALKAAQDMMIKIGTEYSLGTLPKTSIYIRRDMLLKEAGIDVTSKTKAKAKQSDCDKTPKGDNGKKTTGKNTGDGETLLGNGKKTDGKNTDGETLLGNGKETKAAPSS
jgi:hypothetical protein